MVHQAGSTRIDARMEYAMVAEIGAGTPPHPTFRLYFEQNLLYLGDYARAIAFTAAADAFDRSVRYEIAFWQMAYTQGASDRA